MSKKSIYAIIGLIVGAVVHVLLHIIAAAIEQRTFADQFSEKSVWWLVGLTLIGLLVGRWLGTEMPQPRSTTIESSSSGSSQSETITRLQALLSFIKLRGRGIRLSDIFAFGSRIDIDTRE